MQFAGSLVFSFAKITPRIMKEVNTMKIILTILGLAFVGALVIGFLFVSAYAIAAALIFLVVYYIIDSIRVGYWE